MNTSEQINELATALAKAQAEMKNATLNKTNPHFRSKYADLAAIRDAIVPVLAKHNLSIVQGTTANGPLLVVTTRLMHSSGQWLQSDYPITNDTNKPQAMGSALTYARRYSLAAMGVIAAEEDDDGNAAQEHGKTNGNGKKVDLSVDEPKDPNGSFGDIEGTDRPRYKGAANKAPDEYLFIQSTIRAQRTVDDLKAWRADPTNRAAVNALPKQWIQHISNEYDDRMAVLLDNAA